jgi:hypothetical protein
MTLRVARITTKSREEFSFTPDNVQLGISAGDKNVKKSFLSVAVLLLVASLTEVRHQNCDFDMVFSFFFWKCFVFNCDRLKTRCSADQPT